MDAHDGHPASEDVFRGRRVTVRVETLPEPNGGTTRFEIVQTADAVAVVAVRRGPSGAHEVLLVRQLRPAVGRELWEIPAGVMDHPGEHDPAVTAARELAEETGYAADEWRLLTRELPSPGFSTEAISIFLATGVHPANGAVAGTPSDPSEIERVRWVSLAGALRDVQSGALDDGKTVLGLTLAAAALGELGSAGRGEQAEQGGQTAMPMDVTNPPFQRRRGNDDVIVARGDEQRATPADAAEQGRAPDLDATLKLDNLLLEEYNYASVTAYQALEDRARMFNLYLLLVGVVASALGAVYQLARPTDPVTTRQVHTLIITLLTVSGVLGFAFFVKVIRLRTAFRDSLIAMNVIKEFYVREFQRKVPHVGHAFHWRLKTIPPGERIGSVTFVICYTIAFLGSLSFAAAALVLDTLLQPFSGLPVSADVQPYVAAAIVFVVALIFHIIYYVRKLNKHQERQLLEKIWKQARQDDQEETRDR